MLHDDEPCDVCGGDHAPWRACPREMSDEEKQAEKDRQEWERHIRVDLFQIGE